MTTPLTELPPGPTFTELRERKQRVDRLAEGQLAALQRFHNGPDLTALRSGPVTLAGFDLRPVTGPGGDHLSVTSTATCVRSLLASPLVGDRARYDEVVAGLRSRHHDGNLTTRGLRPGNPYTLGQLLPTYKRMVGDADDSGLAAYGVERLVTAVAKRGVRIGKFPPSGYLTYWALVALDAWDALGNATGKQSIEWSRDELYRQLALFASADDEADAYQLGYTVLIQRRFRRSEFKDSVVIAALRALFDAQLAGGLWEKKEPLFTYGRHGDAYPFAFELLNAVLREFADAPEFLVPHGAALERAIDWAARNAYGGAFPLWRSGHLADQQDPESWATAEVYFFLQNYRTYLADRILAGVMRETGRGRPPRPANRSSFSVLYQPAVTLPPSKQEHLIGDLLAQGMLEPLRLPAASSQQYSLARHPNRRSLPRSGIFFGPPGTGKTTYASAIADYLGWPMLTITPADFAAEGMLSIPTVGRRIFDRLLELEDTVIFFDEMEELMRKREVGSFEQRFLTTSLLPALQDLRDAASCVYFVATNNFDQLDMAARAPRRFDFQLQVRPPSYDEKLRMLEASYPNAATAEVKDELDRERKKLEWATLREARALFGRLDREPANARDLMKAFEPSLFAELDALEKESTNNSFDVAA